MPIVANNLLRHVGVRRGKTVFNSESVKSGRVQILSYRSRSRVPGLKFSTVNNQHCWMPAGRYDKGIPEQGSIAEPAGANRVLFPDW